MLVGEVRAIVANGQTFVVVFDPATHPPAPFTLLKRRLAAESTSSAPSVLTLYAMPPGAFAGLQESAKPIATAQVDADKGSWLIGVGGVSICLQHD